MTITINLPLPTDKKIAMERGVLGYFTGEQCLNKAALYIEKEGEMF